MSSTFPEPAHDGLQYFRKTSDAPLAWLEASPNLDKAKKPLISLASTEPGNYFIWDPTDHTFIEPLLKSI